MNDFGQKSQKANNWDNFKKPPGFDFSKFKGFNADKFKDFHK